MRQIKREYDANKESMQKYLRLTNHLTQEFDWVEITQVPKSQNMGTNKLAKQALSEAGPTGIDLRMEVQKRPSIEEVLTFVIQNEINWMTPIVSFLQDGWLPQDVEEVRKVKKRAVMFIILNDVLYKRDFSMSHLKCVDNEEAKYIQEEIHEGICGDHVGPRSLVSKVIRIVTSALLYRRIQGSSSRDVTNAKGLRMFNASQQRD